MTLDEAIKILTLHQRKSHIVFIPELADAIKLGIEALKAFTDFRKGLVVDFELPLPGETK